MIVCGTSQVGSDFCGDFFFVGGDTETVGVVSRERDDRLLLKKRIPNLISRTQMSERNYRSSNLKNTNSKWREEYEKKPF